MRKAVLIISAVFILFNFLVYLIFGELISIISTYCSMAAVGVLRNKLRRWFKLY